MRWSCSISSIIPSCSSIGWQYLKLSVQWETPDDGQKNCPKHADFDSKNKCEKSVHLVGFIIRMYHDARSCECQRRKANWIGHISLRNCLLERVIEGKIGRIIKVMGRRGKDIRSCFINLGKGKVTGNWNEEVLGGTQWGTYIGRCYWLFVKHTYLLHGAESFLRS